MSERKIIPSGRGMGVLLVDTSDLVVCVTAEYLRTGSGRYSKHRQTVLSLLGWLWRAHTIDTSHTLRVQTEQNRRTPSGRSNGIFCAISSVVREYLERALGLKPAKKVRKHNFVFQVVMYDPKDPDQSFICDTILVASMSSIQQLSARIKSSPLKVNAFEVFVRDLPDSDRKMLISSILTRDLKESIPSSSKAGANLAHREAEL